MERTWDLPENGASARRLSGFERALCAAALLSIVMVWMVAYLLTPDARGIGTHEQLGLASCRMITFFGIPCAFCGMTTAFAHLAHGNFTAALITQPAAVVIAALTVPAAFVAGFSAAQGVVPLFVSSLASSRRVVGGMSLVVFAAWIYKIVVHV